MLPAIPSTESFSLDAAEKEPDGCALYTCHSHHSNKEYEFNQFFISAETSSLQENPIVNDGNGGLVIKPDEVPEPNDKPAKSLDFGVFHGILESDDLEILPSARTHLELPAGTHDNGHDSSPESDVDVDGANTSDKKSDFIAHNLENGIKTSVTIAEAQSFLQDIRQHSDARFRILEEVSSLSSDEVKVAETEHLKTELDLIDKLDTKLQLLESAEPSTCSSRHPLSVEGCKTIPSAVVYLRNEKKRWKRQLLLKKALRKLDVVESQNSSKHILRNIQLGPRARYFSLTKEEEDMVEELLSRPDFVDDETSEGNSTTSSVSTAFDLEGDDALRMAEIDEKLEQFIEIHSQCGSPSLISVTWSIPKLQSVCSQNSNGEMKTPSLEGNASRQGEPESGPQSFASSVEDYLAEKKESRKHQEKVESIDRRLRELISGEVPLRLPKDQLDMLITQGMMEQNLEVTMRPFLCLKT
ncbi:hypothetical protein GOP47_0013472 [Adiantum capillus-veneris]|uniref:Uncharacterized protein n=1 Tax=Adiantum capillus-veneris TaxID=13818 RepID=A0A9D4UPA1_ADICA|nr:hypothetical protein GOP47_0013472 [Adiantum capillus-veneris]